MDTDRRKGYETMNDIPKTTEEKAAAWDALMKKEEAYPDTTPGEAAAQTLEYLHLSGISWRDYLPAHSKSENMEARSEPPPGYRVGCGGDPGFGWAAPFCWAWENDSGDAESLRSSVKYADAIAAAWEHYDTAREETPPDDDTGGQIVPSGNVGQEITIHYTDDTHVMELRNGLGEPPHTVTGLGTPNFAVLKTLV